MNSAQNLDLVPSGFRTSKVEHTTGICVTSLGIKTAGESGKGISSKPTVLKQPPVEAELAPSKPTTKMAFKFIIFAAVLTYANAGVLNAPLAYSPASAVSSAYYSTPVATAYATGHVAPLAATYATGHVAPVAPVAIHAPAVGATHQSVLRSLGGNQAVSHYSKAVDSAFSSVRKYDTRYTNDAISVAHTPVAYAAHGAPVVSAVHAAPVAVKTALTYSPAVAVAHTNFEGLGVHYAY